MRTLKPEACSSESLAEVDREVRWTFACLWTHCDDEGRAVHNLRLIKAAIYPLDDDMTPREIGLHLQALNLVRAVCFYRVDDKEYLHVPAWHEHQHPNRPVPSKLPPCPTHDASRTTNAHDTEDSLPCPARLTPVGEGRGEVEGGEADPPSMFCSNHPKGTEKPCGPCGTAKMRHAAFLKAQISRQTEATQRQSRALLDERAEARRNKAPRPKETA